MVYQLICVVLQYNQHILDLVCIVRSYKHYWGVIWPKWVHGADQEKVRGGMHRGFVIDIIHMGNRYDRGYGAILEPFIWRFKGHGYI